MTRKLTQGKTQRLNKRDKAPAIVLGSASPRRKDLLGLIGLDFRVVVPNIEEKPRLGESARDYVLRNAQEKATEVARLLRQSGASFPHDGIIVSADTIVVLNEAILEKPLHAAHAQQMLRVLSGQTHTVISGVCLRYYTAAGHIEADHARTDHFAVTTEVTLKQLSDREIDSYIATGEPMDKAGGYAAQGIGSYMVKRIEGSYTNVVGLPIAELVESLERHFSYPLFCDPSL